MPDPARPDAQRNHRRAQASVRQAGAREGDDHLRKLTDALKENLRKCADDPDVDAVHDTRTGTRRIEAVLEAELRNAGLDSGNGQDELTRAARAWERLLKTVRRAAAPVRDLDVQRKLLKTLVPVAIDKTQTSELGSRMAEHVDRLDGALKGEREHHAASLKKNAAKWVGRLEEHFTAYAAVRRQSQRRRYDAAKTALNAFARLADHMRLLDAGNLHDFRKGAKKARYMAEQGSDDERAQMIGKALKKLQDEIGDWHDWLMLTDEAYKYLDENGRELTAEIQRRRDLHFEMAMEVERKMRGRLIGEGLANLPSRVLAARAHAPSAQNTATRRKKA